MDSRRRSGGENEHLSEAGVVQWDRLREFLSRCDGDVTLFELTRWWVTSGEDERSPATYRRVYLRLHEVVTRLATAGRVQYDETAGTISLPDGRAVQTSRLPAEENRRSPR
jgi:hypothetical protein